MGELSDTRLSVDKGLPFVTPERFTQSGVTGELTTSWGQIMAIWKHFVTNGHAMTAREKKPILPS
ncbi:MAG TPA: hypothetical protein PLV07_09535 [Acidiphilium sp.]|uniref:hypothetical protein n=1 Tax=unclassified Acidiphilium TaxID=2617493 RepID=UPI00157A4C1E|nr:MULTISPECIES: hypothetical protein [unclassified Acidiphilium]HQT61982.1 hypothetical protein [Acidiphilium sp.]HQU11810.1 hypothetical protein [Acidiphilium sp.]